MSFIQKIKNYFGKYFLSRELKKIHRQKKFLNINEAQTIGIVFEATEREEFELVRKYVTYLKEMKKKVKAIGFFNQRNVSALAYSKLEYDFFSLKDLSWYNAPANLYVKNFMQDECDILIDLNIRDLFPLHYVSALSRARFKVGKKNEENNSIFDMMIESDETKSLKYFLRNIDNYLFVINRKQEEKNH